MQPFMSAVVLIAAFAGSLDFRNYRLGSSLEEFKARPAPAAQAQVVCSDTGSHAWLRPEPALVQAGVVNCSFTERSSGSAGPVPIMLVQDIPAAVEFSFYEGRLYRVAAETDARHGGTVRQALTERWGTPAATRHGELRDGSGAIVRQTIYEWRDGRTSALVAIPGSAAQSMSVVYSDTAVSQEVERRRLKLSQPERIM